MLNSTRTSILNERSLEKHDSSAMALIRNVNNKSKKRKNELHEMITKEVKQSMQDMFKQLHQHHHSDNNSDIDKSHHVEAMEDITVSECFNLSDLHQPPTKKTKTQHFAPITTALLATNVV
jgi:hypothetical protein